jgi:hypothetical protein
MANAIVGLEYTSVSGIAAGTVAANVVVAITGTATGNTTPQTQTVATGAVSATFFSVVPDSYTYVVTNTTADGTVIPTPSPVTGSFTITAPTTITLSLVTSATVTQA